jgi:hypothetical protein
MRARRTLAVVVATLATVAVGTTGVAYAYWTMSGSGTGTVTVAEAKPLDITQVRVTGLFPGSPDENLAVTVSNPNAFIADVTDYVLSVTGDVDKGGCGFSENFALTPPEPHASTVPAKESISFNGGSIRMRNLASTDQNACQGATITLTYTLTK